MANSAALNWRVFSDNKPPFDGDFVVAGDGFPGPQPPLPTGVHLLTKETPYVRISALEQDPTTKRIVVGTERADQRFAYSDDLGVSWTLSDPVLGFTGFCTAIRWLEGLGFFLGVAAPGSSHRFLTSPDGISWTRYVPVNAGEIVFHTGIAYSPVSGVVVVGFNDVVMSYNSINWSHNPFPKNLSPVWNSDRQNFWAVQDITGNIYESDDGNNWDPLGVMPGSVAGANLAISGFDGRIIVFCNDTFARYTDDSGANWSIAAGSAQNTGSVNRYVAVESNRLYVAYQAELNLAAISVDNGGTWQQSAHRSGFATAISAMAGT